MVAKKVVAKVVAKNAKRRNVYANAKRANPVDVENAEKQRQRQPPRQQRWQLLPQQRQPLHLLKFFKNMKLVSMSHFC